ncbi:5-oxoprolinase subunit PxpA [Pseudoalteromonas sp. SR44-5]|uniref:5-oxoprolinase subunit PxpA n=1 Tax=unclassified Pseudoalteromonas TaxID=194690 RepID=UPI0016013274|nr:MULTISPECIES: 5-oxoprolinase subunit PxpA [unclassified Pseudoalteromonas]MBB1340410.1 5-oxoprolinase subunit PxpA [Pseudoalteromonas sp. SR45-6]MBB1365346.1 5-oxoprolinase subunit PxpA [Pseudoalteromonas sp. SR44-5]MBB1434031.1 5-oxoprolinase subunit PxpA [Pseudoalteromonas sp. SG43-6]MBB1478654.1 5-oxoprolinase subunit PxpA [Pseudoalteromonas sp. SG41-2]
MKLNCDLGESFGAWQMGLDEEVMPHIDMANIACGFHGGDSDVLARTLMLAKQHDVIIGAHPSYPDKQGFGRRSMALTPQELSNCLHYQIAAIEGMARVQGLTLEYVKPHGALYNDMMADKTILTTVMQAVASYPSPLKLMLLATAKAEQHQQLAQQYHLELILEAFADRQYTDDGQLVSRKIAGSVHDKPALIAQVKQLLATGCVTTQSGNQLPLHADSLCVHGDNAAGIALIQEIKALCHTR